MINLLNTELNSCFNENLTQKQKRKGLTEECWPEVVAYKNDWESIFPSMAQASKVSM